MLPHLSQLGRCRGHPRVQLRNALLIRLVPRIRALNLHGPLIRARLSILRGIF